MPDYNGVTWRVNYGELGEQEQFRVGRRSLETYDAYFAIGQLADLIATLNAVSPLLLGITAKGATVEAVKVTDGFVNEIVISPRLDTGTPSELMRLRIEELTDLIYALSLFQEALGNEDIFPDDWDVSRPIRLTYDQLPRELAQFPEVLESIQQGGSGGYIKPVDGIPKTDFSNAVQTSLSRADSLDVLVTTGYLAQPNLDTRYAAKSVQDLVTEGRLSQANLDTAYAAASSVRAFTTASVSATANPADFPVGVTYGPVASGSGFPINTGTAVTYRSSNTRSAQFIYEKGGAQRVWYRSPNSVGDGWDPVLLMAGSQIFPALRVKSGGSYPARVDGVPNIWAGDTNPGILLQTGDVWANPNVTTLDEVVSQALDISTPLNAAIRTASNQDVIPLNMIPRPGDTGVAWSDVDGGGSQELWGISLPYGSSAGAFGGTRVPYGWVTASVQATFFVPSVSGNLRLGWSATGFRDDENTPAATASVFNTVIPSTPFAGKVYNVFFTGAIDLTLKNYIQVVIKRVPGGLDTANATIHLLQAAIRKAS